MINEHKFKLKLNWELNKNKNKRISRNHEITIYNNLNFNVSAAKVFKGDAELINPEDLLLSSITSCHFMSFLYCCSLNKIELLKYTDQSEALLEVLPNGSGKISRVILNPTFTIADESQKELAISLHKKANELCFIANSCNFPIIHNPICIIKTKISS